MKNSVDNLGTASGADVGKPVTGEAATVDSAHIEPIEQPLPLTSAQIADRLTALQEQAAKQGREIRLEAAKHVRDKLLAKESLTDADKIMLAEVEQGIAQELAAAAPPVENPHPESSFAPGDLVQLRSGGPVMTLVRLRRAPYGADVVFMSSVGMQQNFVPIVALMPYKRRLYASDEMPTPPQRLPQQKSDQPKDERLDAILRASERKASALERIAAAIEQIADYMETR